MPTKYNLTLSQKQAEVLVRALDLYSRIGTGQFEEVLQVYDAGHKLDISHRRNMRRDLNAAKAEAGHPENGSHGIHNPEVRDEFRVAFDIHQVVRNRLALVRNPKGGMTVDFDKPNAIGGEPLAEISTTDS